MMRLSELRVGERAVVRRVEGTPLVRRRLQALGFVAGVEVAVRRCAPMGDPVAYELLGYCLSLRREEAALVLVERLAVYSLAVAPKGRLRVVEIGGGRGMRQHLAELGIGEGVVLTKVSDGQPGPVVVAVRGQERPVGLGMAQRVWVVVAGPGDR